MEIRQDDATRWIDPFLRIEARFSGAGPVDLNPDRLTIVCVRSGSAVLELTDRQVSMNEGELLLIGCQGCKRIGGWQSQSCQIAVLSFCRDTVVEGSSLVESVEYLRGFEARSTGAPQVISGSQELVNEIVDLMSRIGKESELNGKHSLLAMKTFLKMILVLLCQQIGEMVNEPTVPPRDVARLQPLLQYLAQHYMDAISVNQAAKVLNMSNSHFMRFFRQATGSAFVTYLNQLRISKAQSLIGQSELSITQVGEAVGFCDHSYFSCVFRRFSGIGPRDYRNQMRRQAN